MKRLLIAALMLLPAMAMSQECAPYDDVKTVLEENFNEFARFEGMDSQGNLLEIFSNERTGTWTAIITQPTGIACVVGVGVFGAVIPLPPNV